MFSRLKVLKDESGQSMILFAVAFVILCVLAALVIDIGGVMIDKAHLQNAADAAALAGAQDLPDASAAKSTAVHYAELNGVEAPEVTGHMPIQWKRGSD